MTSLQKVWGNRDKCAEGDPAVWNDQEGGAADGLQPHPGGLTGTLCCSPSQLSQPGAREVHSGLDRREACGGDHRPTETRSSPPEPASRPSHS